MEALGHIAVIGAGAMGAGIAQVAAAAGHRVHLVDALDGAATTARDDIAARLAGQVAKGRISGAEAADTVARIHVDVDVAGLPEVALVIEAVKEDLAVKQSLFSALAAGQPPTTVLASNTSSLDIDAIADAVHDPERVIGLHFFNPAPIMKLVEVVGGRCSAAAYLDFGASLVRSWGKTAVRCASTPGFIVNRVARPFYGEAQRLLAAGVAGAATIDAAVRSAGFKLGPLELTDLIGQDVNLAVGTSVWERTDHDPRYAPTALQQQLVADGRLGRKSGRGIYRYASDGRPEAAEPDADRVAELVGGPVTTDPVARTLAMLVNEAVDLVDRGEASADDVDLAMVLGTGYPRGPIAWGQEIGFDVVADQLAQLDAAFPRGPISPESRTAAGWFGTPRVVMSEVSSPEPDLSHVRRMWRDDPASAHLGMELLILEPDHAVVRMSVTDVMTNGHGSAHGGYLFLLADSTFALVCNSGGRTTVAAAADITFTAPGLLGDVLVAEGWTRTTYGRNGITDVRVTRESDGVVLAEFRGRSRSLPAERG